MSDLRWQTVLVLGALAYAGFCGLLCIHVRRKNRRINLPPPSDACRRNSVESL